MCQEGGPRSPVRANFASMVFGPGTTSGALDVLFLRSVLRGMFRCVRMHRDSMRNPAEVSS